MAAQRFPVEAGHILLFARAIGDPNPIYADPDHAKTSEPGGIIAPPTFTQAAAHFDPAYPLRPRPGERWIGSAREDAGGRPPGSEGGGIGLYAEHRFEYHRHLRPGDELHAVTRLGESWEKEGRRGGKLRFQEHVTEFFDETGELVVTSVVVGVVTEKPVG